MRRIPLSTVVGSDILLTVIRDRELSFSRFRFLRHLEVELECVLLSFPNHTFYNFFSTVSSPRLKTCLLLGYRSDLDNLKGTLQATPKPESQSIFQSGKGQPKRNVEVTIRLHLLKEEADAQCTSVKAAMDSAIENGIFDFLDRDPELRVRIFRWKYVQE